MPDSVRMYPAKAGGLPAPFNNHVDGPDRQREQFKPIITAHGLVILNSLQTLGRKENDPLPASLAGDRQLQCLAGSTDKRSVWQGYKFMDTKPCGKQGFQNGPIPHCPWLLGHPNLIYNLADFLIRQKLDFPVICCFHGLVSHRPHYSL